ncbi:MAG: FecR domain-containing protein [candidate division KSB1 bacterium]|nr:FecR domain-containing protein [candidate division KSB1 bacterium]
MSTIQIKKVLLVFVIGSFLVAYSGEGNQKQEKKGLVTYVDGRVKKKALDSEDWITAAQNTEVLGGDKVRTYQMSRAELELLQLDVVRMAPQTTIDIVKLYEETKEEKREIKINVEQGDIWAKVNPNKKGAKFTLTTPTTAAAITGTTLRMNVAPDSTTQLKVYQGEVHITNAPERTDLRPQSIKPYEVPGPYQIPGPTEVTVEQWLYIIKSMQQITVSPRGQIVSKGSFSPKDPDEQSEWVKWNKQRDKLFK